MCNGKGASFNVSVFHQHEGSLYIRNPFTQEQDWVVSSMNLDLNELLKKSEMLC